MKKSYIVTFSILVALTFILWMFTKNPEQTGSTANNVPSSTQQLSRYNISNVTPPAGPMKNKSQETIVEGVPVSQQVMRYMQNVKADPTYDWKQPINFYGKAVDESNQPLAGAQVEYTWSALVTNGTVTKHVETDGSGLFSIHEIGKRISVTVTKEGYYTTPSEKLRTYEYANPADGLFSPDPYNPVIFHLRKKGVGVDLITSRQGMSPDFPIHVPRDGTPVILDVLQRKVGDSGQIQISENKPDQSSWKQATTWSFQLQIPDGGFVEAHDEFHFEAPDEGYQSVVNFQFQKDSTNWAENINKTYYIEFGNPPQYGLFQVQTGISYGGAIITYAINPSGSRNLEPK